MAENSSLYTNPDTGYEIFLSDEADLLTDQEEVQLTEYMEPITQYGNCAFDSVYVRSGSSYSYAEQYYGDYFEESGTLFLIDMGNREIHLYSSGEIEKTVTASYANSITDNIYTYASDGDYYQCAQKAFTQELTLLQGGRIAQPMKYISCAFLALIIAFLINYFIVRAKAKNKKSPQYEIMKAVAVSAAVGGATTAVTKVVRHSSGGGGGFGGRGGSSFTGGGGGGFSGGGHKF